MMMGCRPRLAGAAGWLEAATGLVTVGWTGCEGTVAVVVAMPAVVSMLDVTSTAVGGADDLSKRVIKKADSNQWEEQNIWTEVSCLIELITVFNQRSLVF